MRFTRLVAAAVLAAAAALLPASAASAAVNQTFNVWHWNVAGLKFHDGGTGTGLITVLSNSIRNRGSHLVSLNELCWSQYKAIQSNLRGSGWPQDVENFSRFESTNDTGCDGEEAGIALFSKAPMGTANRVTLPEDGRTEKRKLLCAPLEARPHLRFCTTHITTLSTEINGSPINEQQLDAVRARVESWNTAGDTVIIAGDFNAQPNYKRLDGWYAPSVNTTANRGNSGAYRELDDLDSRCPGYGENTEDDGTPAGPCGPGKKIDLIFVRESRIAGAYDGDSLSISNDCGGPCSDHRIVIGTVTVSITT
ncbi:endonuclease/exonuclease/phosphatase family protein [Catenuloplanes indicus]|uniref:Endonuclease/exonuclease/phosphatase family metal-dependent hydrolase n=1 Tax=Catenuloplanes indicus TaxID=137267 RepID=A0AAE3VXN0_9ACTN|nr:endonuclease/exonuclease/phosphatase family protein [Catenuloplanes indicus]MDQ0365585.1 endonuclease/exonuclease/phosphatase family metal-dependent hydrolase [Catenuloplanes indicus]